MDCGKESERDTQREREVGLCWWMSAVISSVVHGCNYTVLLLQSAGTRLLRRTSTAACQTEQQRLSLSLIAVQNNVAKQMISAVKHRMETERRSAELY